MNLKLLEFDQCPHDFEKADQLYHEAFPKEERAPMSFLIQKAQHNEGDFLYVYDDRQWIGFVYVITYRQLSYVFYLAVDHRLRGSGYGSAILEMLQRKYPYTIMLCIEEVKEKYDNYKQRVKRKDFYLKNGFKEMDFYFIEFGVRYEMLYTGKRLPSQYFDELMFHYVGEKYKEYRVFD